MGRRTFVKAVALLTVMVAWAAAPAFAQAEGGLKVGYVDVPRALKGTQAAEAAIATLKAEFEKKKAELEGMADAIASKERELEAQRQMVTEEALKEGQRQLEDLRREAARFQADAREDMTRREASIIQDQMKTLLVAIREISSEGGFHIVYQVSRERVEEAGLVEADEKRPIFDPGAGLIYADPSLDLTDQVITRMNQKDG